MRYEHVTGAIFLDRPNRFTAHVTLNGRPETVHVKNTGRCRELLLPGVEVYLAAADKAERKTKHDLIAVRRTDGKVVNIDSQAPNQVVYEWLCSQGFQTIIPEYRYGESRIAFFMARGKERYLMEVKGCTLEIDGVGYFPDAPTERGVKHVRELGKAATDGFHAVLAFVIPMDGVKQVCFYCNRDGLFSADVVRGIDDRDRSHDDTQERRELEQAADMLFGKGL